MFSGSSSRFACDDRNQRPRHVLRNQGSAHGQTNRILRAGVQRRQRRALEADSPIACKSASGALRTAERLAKKNLATANASKLSEVGGSVSETPLFATHSRNYTSNLFDQRRSVLGSGQRTVNQRIPGSSSGAPAKLFNSLGNSRDGQQHATQRLSDRCRRPQ